MSWRIYEPTSGNGKVTAWVPARAMTPTDTDGAELVSVELGTNRTMIVSLDFDKDTQEHAQFTVALPKSWNGGTVTAQFLATFKAGVEAETLDFGIQGKAVVENGDLDAAWGSAVVATLTHAGEENTAKWSAETAAFELTGDPTDPSVAIVQVFRKVSTDNLSVDGSLLGIKFFFTEDKDTDA